jgi:hypothetical protein
MAPARSKFSSVVELLLILLVVLPFSHALKFDLIAHSGHSAKNERCIRNFVNRDTLVVVTATISGSRGDGQIVNMHVSGLNATTRIRGGQCARAPEMENRPLLTDSPTLRSKMLLATITGGLKTLLARRGWLSPV